MSTSSYGQILKSSSIVGGAQGASCVIGLLRTKAVAVLLGPAGVGLVGLYVSVIDLVGTFAQFGIDESGVRGVAAAAGTNNVGRLPSRTLRALYLRGYLARLGRGTGVQIGEGAVVGAGAVVSKNVDPYTIVAGSPAKPVGSRTRELSYRSSYAPWLI